MALTTEFASEKFCLAICPAFIFIIAALVVTFFIYLRSRRQPEFSSFEGAFSFYTLSILNIGSISSIILGVFLVLIGFFLIAFAFLSFNMIFIVFGIFMIIPGLTRLLIGVIKGRSIREQIMKEPPWKKAITKRKLKITPDSISSLFAYLQNLKILVSWVMVAGTLAIIWGLLEVPGIILFIDDFVFSDNAILLFLLPIIKVIVGSLLLIGSKQLMIKPLRTEEFWIKAISER